MYSIATFVLRVCRVWIKEGRGTKGRQIVNLDVPQIVKVGASNN